tara:strand:- start:3294 stop:5369 length:2076 start_codon:yes stop_codon:yes gene_type:complete
MPYILVEDFRAGLDTRRTEITSIPGSARTLTNCHISRGGEIEKRKAFVTYATLPTGTHGLATAGGQVYVFGSGATPDMSSVPENVNYIRFQPPSGVSSTTMTEVLGVDFFNGEPYVSTQFSDGRIYHYWNNYTGGTDPTNRVNDWYEIRARSSFSITGGSAGGTAATGTFTVTGGTFNPGNLLRWLRINNRDIISGTVAHTGVHNDTATAIAGAINDYTSVPNYTASASGAVVTITASTVGTGSNGYVVSKSVEGDFTGTQTNMSGGVDNAITNITVDGVSIIDNPVLWETSHTYTAQKVAEEINDALSSPEWEATSVDAKVNIIAKEGGTDKNSKTVAITKTGNVTHDSPSATSGGAPVSTSNHKPGGFVRSFNAQMHSVSDSLWHTSKTDDPSEWTDTNHAAWEDLSNHDKGSSELLGIAPYFENVAIFSEDSVQIWNADPNPTNRSLIQVIGNTGAVSSKTIHEIGDSDVYYLSRSGVRSVKARDSSNAAFASDLGNSIDDLVIAEMALSDENARNACAILDPRDGRYYCAIGNKVYVYSYFPGSKVSAWSTYEPGFTISDWAFDGRQVLCRSGDTIYSLGGENNTTYDSCTVTIQLPFLDAGKAAHNKMWTGLDATLENDWDFYIGTDPTDISKNEQVATIGKSTYSLGRVGLSSTSTHLALKITNQRAGAAKIGNVAIHYELNEAG